MHTFSQKELSPPHSINAAPLAPPQSSAGPHPTTEPLKPLRQFISAWKVIPGISRWLLSVIERGYTLQFRRRPPRFNGVVQSLTSPRNAQALRQEIGCLLEKGAVERVPPNELESGFYSRYFVVPKRDGGLRPILDLRPINRALCERPFRMITLKQILAQIRPGDWFASVDLKDAYFHIQIAPHHRRFLRFAFENTAYQYSVLPFGLALAPRTFSKCVDAALSPLRASGMRILNYLDDWLILAQSRDTLLSHIDSLLVHLESLGLCVNRRKSILAPSQSIMYLGVCMDSLEMRARLSRERVAAILSYLRHFREGRSVHLKKFQRLLGLMASASAVCHLGLLHMRPLQLWLKTRVPWTAWTSGRLSIAATGGCIEALAPWLNPDLFSRGVPLGLVTSRVVVSFLKGARRLHPPRPPSVPPWDLEVVLRALSQPPFEPLTSVGLKELSLKTTLLLALASAKRIGDLHAFSVDSDCIRFGPGDCSVTLRLRMGYVPKSLSTPFKTQTVSLSALSSESTASREADAQTSVCPVRALRIYIDRSASFRQSDQLFVCYGGCVKGRAVSKQRISHWIVDAITAAYTSQGLECPLHIRGHSTRAIASSWAWSRGMSIQDICAAAGWSSQNTFARFYRLDVQSFASQVLSVSG